MNSCASRDSDLKGRPATHRRGARLAWGSCDGPAGLSKQQTAQWEVDKELTPRRDRTPTACERVKVLSWRMGSGPGAAWGHPERRGGWLDVWIGVGGRGSSPATAPGTAGERGPALPEPPRTLRGSPRGQPVWVASLPRHTGSQDRPSLLCGPWGAGQRSPQSFPGTGSVPGCSPRSWRRLDGHAGQGAVIPALTQTGKEDAVSDPEVITKGVVVWFRPAAGEAALGEGRPVVSLGVSGP